MSSERDNDEFSAKNIGTAIYRESSRTDVTSEEAFRETRRDSWKKHDELYTDVLSSYIENSKKMLKSKRIQKWWFFVLSMGMLIIVVSIAAFSIYGIVNTESSETRIVELISALVVFCTPLLVIPKLIAKYLFNSLDEGNMIEIVKQIIILDKDTN